MPTTSNFGWTTPADTDLVKDGAAAIRTLGSGIDTSLVDLKGGTTGQILSKASNTDLDFTWTADASGIPATIFDAKGDLIAASAADTAARLAVGANGTVLTADSSTSTGLKWAAAAGGGKVLQVVQSTYTTDVSMSTTSFTDTGLSQAITPTSASSKILVVAIQSVYVESSPEVTTAVGMRILRDSTTIFTQGASSQSFGARAIEALDNVPLVYLDSPSTTSSITYKIQARNNDTTSGRYAYFNVGDSTITLLEIGA